MFLSALFAGQGETILRQQVQSLKFNINRKRNLDTVNMCFSFSDRERVDLRGS